jgi:hypothetical protein
MEKIINANNPLDDFAVLSLYIEKIIQLLNKHIIDYRSE